MRHFTNALTNKRPTAYEIGKLLNISATKVYNINNRKPRVLKGKIPLTKQPDLIKRIKLIVKEEGFSNLRLKNIQRRLH